MLARRKTNSPPDQGGRKELMWNAVLVCLLLTSPAVLAENLAYQFVCSDNGDDVFSGWMDERNNVRTSFSKGRSGTQFFYCEADCRPDFGIIPCSFTPIYELGHYEPPPGALLRRGVPAGAGGGRDPEPRHQHHRRGHHPLPGGSTATASAGTSTPGARTSGS
jgi:hypothetical protein